VCPYCATLFRHNPALAPNEARPPECEFHESPFSVKGTSG
jgi:hypothetical protein